VHRDRTIALNEPGNKGAGLAHLARTVSTTWQSMRPIARAWRTVVMPSNKAPENCKLRPFTTKPSPKRRSSIHFWCVTRRARKRLPGSMIARIAKYKVGANCARPPTKTQLRGFQNKNSGLNELRAIGVLSTTVFDLWCLAMGSRKSWKCYSDGRICRRVLANRITLLS
jgi:hypothetical protein